MKLRGMVPGDYEQALLVLNEDCIHGQDDVLASGGLDYYRERGLALLAEDEGVALGYLLALASQTWNIVKVQHIFVSPECRRIGVARALYEHLITEARTRGSFVIVCNFVHQRPLSALHETLGFELEERASDQVVARLKLQSLPRDGRTRT